MQKVIGLTAVIFALAGIAAAAQDSPEGVITYEVKVNRDSIRVNGEAGISHKRPPRTGGGKRSPGPRVRHAGMPPHAPYMALFFRGGESLYKPAEQEEEEDFRFSSGRRTMRIGNLHNETYKNSGTGEQLRSLELMNKRYLIESSLTQIPWKLTEDTMSILGYRCKRAWYHSMKDDRDITAWYTEELRVPAGPAGYHSLPGMILELNAGDGDMVIRAISVDLRSLEKNELKRPKKGKTVSEEEFKRIREAELKRMRERAGGMPGKPVIMRQP